MKPNYRDPAIKIQRAFDACEHVIELFNAFFRQFTLEGQLLQYRSPEVDAQSVLYAAQPLAQLPPESSRVSSSTINLMLFHGMILACFILSKANVYPLTVETRSSNPTCRQADKS